MQVSYVLPSVYLYANAVRLLWLPLLNRSRIYIFWIAACSQEINREWSRLSRSPHAVHPYFIEYFSRLLTAQWQSMLWCGLFCGSEQLALSSRALSEPPLKPLFFQVSQLHPCYKFRLSSITYLTMWCMTFDLRFLPFQVWSSNDLVNVLAEFIEYNIRTLAMMKHYVSYFSLELCQWRPVWCRQLCWTLWQCCSPWSGSTSLLRSVGVPFLESTTCLPTTSASAQLCTASSLPSRKYFSPAWIHIPIGRIQHGIILCAIWWYAFCMLAHDVQDLSSILCSKDCYCKHVYPIPSDVSHAVSGLVQTSCFLSLWLRV